MSETIEQTKAETQQKYWEVDAQNVSPLNRAGGNLRTDYGEDDGTFQELVDSIRENGVIVPVRGFRDKDNEGKWISIDGHRRLLAANKLITEENLNIKVRIIVVDARKVSDEQIIYEMILTNSGKPLSPVEMAEGVRRLIAHGNKPKDIAKRFGKTVELVNNLAFFAAAPKRLRDLVASKRASYTLVLDLLRSTKDFNTAIEMIEAALTVAKKEAAKKKDIDPETDTSAPLEYKATKKHLDTATNRVDSMKELQMVIRAHEESKIFPNNQYLYNFAKKLAQNQLTATDIKKMLTEQVI